MIFFLFKGNKQISLLAHDEEIELASTWIKDKCFDSAHKLINCTFRLV